MFYFLLTTFVHGLLNFLEREDQSRLSHLTLTLCNLKDVNVPLSNIFLLKEKKCYVFMVSMETSTESRE